MQVRSAKCEMKGAFVKELDRKPKNLKRFLEDAHLYLHVNKDTYDTDDVKSAFILFLFTGEAALGKEQFLGRYLEDDGDYNFPEYDDFIITLKKEFKDIDAKTDGLYKLRTIE